MEYVILMNHVFSDLGLFPVYIPIDYDKKSVTFSKLCPIKDSEETCKYCFAA